MEFYIRNHSIISSIVITLNVLMFIAMLVMRQYILAGVNGASAVFIYWADGRVTE
jgi:hypothetical protein